MSNEINNSEGPSKWERDENGLLKSIQYIFNEDGSVNWRAMIGADHLYANKDWFAVRGQPVPDSIEGLEDHQLAIKLSGIKELAKLRGIHSVGYEIVRSEDHSVTVACQIHFLENYENPEGVVFTSMANATDDNVNGFGAKFLETIAENRAFVRCVRNFLNIHIVGADEMDTSKKGPKVTGGKSSGGGKDLSPQGILRSKVGTDFETFKKGKLTQLYKEKKYEGDPEVIKDWSDFSDVPAKECRKLMKLV